MKITGQLLVSLPTIQDGAFRKSVIYMHEFDEHGAVGFVINKKYPSKQARQIAFQLKLSDPDRIYYGGPIEPDSGFVLHTDDYHGPHTSAIHGNSRLYITSGMSVINDIIAGDGPRDYMILLGHCGWGPGQLEAEIAGTFPYQSRGWVMTTPDSEFFFGKMDSIRCWDTAIRKTARDMSQFILDV